jgi:hypothetical protein
MAHKKDIYDYVLEVATYYLGPAAPRFIDRQILNHLQKRPDQLNLKDLPTLIDWARAALSLLTENTAEVEEFTSRLQVLTKER